MAMNGNVMNTTYKYLQTYERNELMIYGGPIVVAPICRGELGI